MKKRKNYLILGIILFLILAVVFGVSYFSDNGILFSPRGVPPCFDTDGENFLTYGEVHSGNTYPDSCEAVFTLTEMICLKKQPAGIRIDCRTLDPGYCCEGGKCQTCSCTKECNTIGERRCIENQPESGNGLYQICGQYDNDPCLEWGPQQSCPNGEQCINGECIEPNIPVCDTDLCLESDEGYNIYYQGYNRYFYISGEDCLQNEYVDYCSDSSTLIEYVGCDGVQHQVTCENGCENGHCIYVNETMPPTCGIYPYRCEQGEENCINCPIDCLCPNNNCLDTENGEPNTEVSGTIDSLFTFIQRYETQTFIFNNQIYSIYAMKDYSGILSVNGEFTPPIRQGYKYRLADGNYIGVLANFRDIIAFYMRNSQNELGKTLTDDYCLNNEAIFELYCNPEKTKNIVFLGSEALMGIPDYNNPKCVRSCSYGTCPVCVDSDNGLNKNIKGFADSFFVILTVGDVLREFIFMNQTTTLESHDISIVNVDCDSYEQTQNSLTVNLDGQNLTLLPHSGYCSDFILNLGEFDLTFSNEEQWPTIPQEFKIFVDYPTNIFIRTSDFCENYSQVRELYCQSGVSVTQETSLACLSSEFCSAGKCINRAQGLPSALK